MVGKFLIVLGVLIVLVGILVIYKVPIPFGNLPGDIVVKGENTTFYFPIVTSILLSLLLSFILYVLSRF